MYQKMKKLFEALTSNVSVDWNTAETSPNEEFEGLLSMVKPIMDKIKPKQFFLLGSIPVSIFYEDGIDALLKDIHKRKFMDGGELAVHNFGDDVSVILGTANGYEELLEISEEDYNQLNEAIEKYNKS